MSTIAFERGDFPISAIATKNSKIVATQTNTTLSSSNRLHHAELKLLHDINQFSDIDGISIHCSMEPCLMCLSAMCHSRVKYVYYYCKDSIAGATSEIPDIYFYKRQLPTIVYRDIVEIELRKLMLNHLEREKRWKELKDMF